MKLGCKQWDMPLFLAPMAGYTDMSFRTLCREYGSDVSVTEMISAKGLFMGSRKTAALLETAEAERPVIVQIFGHEPQIMAEMAKRIEEMMGEAMFALDINMGCPAPKITGNGEGSALMRDPLLVGRIVEAVAKTAAVPVTVKIRKGYDAEHMTHHVAIENLTHNGIPVPEPGQIAVRKNEFTANLTLNG